MQVAAENTPPWCPPPSRYNRQDDVRWTLEVVQDGVTRQSPLGLIVVVPAGVQIAVEAREVATGDLQANAMSRAEVVARGVEIDHHFVCLARFHPDLLVKTLQIIYLRQ